MSLSNKKGKLTYSLVLDRFCSLGLVFDFVSNHRLLPRQILNCPTYDGWAGFVRLARDGNLGIKIRSRLDKVSGPLEVCNGQNTGG